METFPAASRVTLWVLLLGSGLAACGGERGGVGCNGGSTKQTSRSRAALAAALKPVWKQLPQSNDELTSASATFPVEAPQPLG